MAKKTRGAVSSVAFRVPKVESITVDATKTTPGGPMSRCATSAATSLECRISSTLIPERIFSASAGPTPEAEISSSKKCFSREVRKPYRAKTSSRTCV